MSNQKEKQLFYIKKGRLRKETFFLLGQEVLRFMANFIQLLEKLRLVNINYWLRMSENRISFQSWFNHVYSDFKPFLLFCTFKFSLKYIVFKIGALITF